jgi:hypothetical protein
MGEVMRSLLYGEDHHTRRPRYSRQFLLPYSVPHNMLHASNLDTTPRSATHQSESVVQVRREAGEISRFRVDPDSGPTEVFKTRRLAAEPESLLDRGS